MGTIGYGPNGVRFENGMEPGKDEAIGNGRPLDTYWAIWGGGAMLPEDIERGRCW